MLTTPHPVTKSVAHKAINKRDRLWAIGQYNCIGRWRFISVQNIASAGYDEALGRLKASSSTETLLDRACCVGQVIRKFVVDGVDSHRLLGADLHPEFIDIGYDLFNDRDRLKATIVSGDIFDPKDAGFAQIEGKASIVHAQAFFHLFDWEGQIAVAQRIAGLLRSDVENAMVFGRQPRTR
jgi:hypothetical protein